MKTFLLSFFAGVMVFLTPIKYFFILAFILVIFDASFSIITKRQINKKRKENGLEEDLSLSITSNRFGKSINKIYKYYASIILGYILDLTLVELIVGILGGVISLPFSTVVLLFIIIREVKSIDETMRLINKDEGLEYYFQTLIKHIKKIKSIVKDIFS